MFLTAETVSADEAEALELLRQARQDEALAKRLQHMMDEEGAMQRSMELAEQKDRELARLLQVSSHMSPEIFKKCF